MPDSREFLNNTISTCSNASAENHNLDEAIQRLKVHDNHEGDGGQTSPYPDRPGEPDCIYYLKTGSCGYGSNCRYNHPTHTGPEIRVKDDLPERVGQPYCQYFLKTGMCKFGASCKYHHPRDGHDAHPVSLNLLGLPIRQDEKSCPYYMRTGSCKFGVVCKFNHPQPGTLGAVLPLAGSPVYASTVSAVASTPSPPLVGGVSAWPLSNRSPYISNPNMQSFPAFMPVIVPPSPSPMQQCWATYMGTVSHHPYSDALGPTLMPSSKNNAQSSPSSTENFPNRPDQPDCQYYMKTGSCKYGSTCKYHHPKSVSMSCTLGPLGLPLRPGQPVCSFYSLHGICRYGSSCKFDHPLVGYSNYTVPAISLPDPLAPFHYQRSPQVAWTSWEDTSAKTMKSEMDNEALPSDNNKEHNFSEQTSSTLHIVPSSESTHNHPN